MMVRMGDADALISGLTQHYPDTLRPALQVIPVREGCHVSGMYVLITPRDRSTSWPIHGQHRADGRGSGRDRHSARRNRRAASTSSRAWPCCRFPTSAACATRWPRRFAGGRDRRQRVPDLMIDGEMQADTAVVPRDHRGDHPFSYAQRRRQRADLSRPGGGNIAYKLFNRIGGAEVIGPILMGMSKPGPRAAARREVNDIVKMTAIAVVDAQL
jgi:malate dehydrogenase (oxaloacetate-decarboxylating)(NADP+)